MSKLINYSVSEQASGHIAVIELHNPPANAYSYEMFRQFDDAVLEARMDDSIHVIVIRGAGEKFFCAGADIEMLKDAQPTFKYYFCLHANETLRRLEETPKLVIAALGGHCVGGGLEVAMAADIRVGKKGGGKIGLPEVGLGVLPGTGGTQRLLRLVGRAKAMELMIRGTNMTMEEAKEIGLVTETLPADNFDQLVFEYAAEFCPPKKASRAVGLIKRAVQTGSEVGLDAGLALERELQQRLFTSEDAKEGIRAFSERRSPIFGGK